MQGRDSALMRALGVDLRRAIWSSRFFLGALLTLGWMVGNCIRERNIAKVIGGPYLFNRAVDGTLYLGPVILAIATIPYAGEFLTERKEGYQMQAAKRVGIEVYGLSKVLSTALSAFLMVLLGVGVFILWMCVLRLPRTIPTGLQDGTYMEWAYTRGTGWYYAAMTLRMGMVCGAASVFSLMVSAYVPNAYVAFFAPIIGYYFLECILNMLSKILPVSPVIHLFSPLGLCFAQIGRDPFVSYVLTVLMLTVGMVLFGEGFLTKLRKEPVL